MRNRLKLKRLRIKVAKVQDKRVAELKVAHAIELTLQDQSQRRLHDTIANLRAIVEERDATIARQAQQLAIMRAALDGAYS